MARSECVALLVSLTVGGCLLKDRPLGPEAEADAGTSGSPSPASASGADSGDGQTARDAATTPRDVSPPPPVTSDAGPAYDATSKPDLPSTQPIDAATDASVAGEPVPRDATTPSVPDAAVAPLPTSVPKWCRPDEPTCRQFDFESEVDAEGYFGPFWCHPEGNCTTQARPVEEAAGSQNHVWVSAVAGDGAKALGCGINVKSYKRTVYQHAEIDFDVWPVSVVNDESAVWFSVQRVDPNNECHALFSLVSNQTGSFVVLGPVYSPDLKLRFTTPPAVGARSHVRIVLDRIDDERSSASITYGGETLRLASLAMPLRDSSGAAAYDNTLGLFDGQEQRSVGAPKATARYDDFVARTTFVP